MEPWVLQAAMNFFKARGVDVATNAIDQLLFAPAVSPQVFGKLFDYRVALTILFRWNGKLVLENPVFATAMVCNSVQCTLHYLHALFTLSFRV
jgi:hypothetical protein